MLELKRIPKIAVDSYTASYPYLLNWFAQRQEWRASDLVCAAHMIYGWMPTILTLHPENGLTLEEGAALLNKAKTEGDLSDEEIQALARLINNSLVGASKLLHFVAPERFAIWDSKICHVFASKKTQHQINKIQNYRAYMNKLNALRQDPIFTEFYVEVQSNLGYAVPTLRALEIVIFYNGVNHE